MSNDDFKTIDYDIDMPNGGSISIVPNRKDYDIDSANRIIRNATHLDRKAMEELMDEHWSDGGSYYKTPTIVFELMKAGFDVARFSLKPNKTVRHSEINGKIVHLLNNEGYPESVRDVVLKAIDIGFKQYYRGDGVK